MEARLCVHWLLRPAKIRVIVKRILKLNETGRDRRKVFFRSHRAVISRPAANGFGMRRLPRRKQGQCRAGRTAP